MHAQRSQLSWKSRIYPRYDHLNKNFLRHIVGIFDIGI